MTRGQVFSQLSGYLACTVGRRVLAAYLGRRFPAGPPSASRSNFGTVPFLSELYRSVDAGTGNRRRYDLQRLLASCEWAVGQPMDRDGRQ